MFLCQTFYGKTTPISGTFLFSHPTYNFPVLFDLNYDPQDLIELNLKDLRDIYISGQKFLKFVKPNKGPILLKKKQVEDSWFFNSININEFQKKWDLNKAKCNLDDLIKILATVLDYVNFLELDC